MIKLARCLTLALFCVSMIRTAALADPYADLIKMGKAYATAHSYKASVSSAGRAIQMDFVAPDRWHFTMGSDAEMVRIGGDMWVKHGGSWMKMPSIAAGSMQHMIGNYQNAVPTGDYRSDYTVTDLGMKDGYHAYLIADKKSPGTSTMYLRPDSLPAKIEATRDGKTATITYSDWNAPFAIDPPK